LYPDTSNELSAENDKDTTLAGTLSSKVLNNSYSANGICVGVGVTVGVGESVGDGVVVGVNVAVDVSEGVTVGGIGEGVTEGSIWLGVHPTSMSNR